MGINQEDFVKTFISALSYDQVVKKIEKIICERLIREVQELRNVIKERDVKINDLEKEVSSLKEAIDQHEQYSRCNNLRISGIEENETDVVMVTLDFINSKVVNESQQVTLDDIDRVHRVGQKQGTPRLILVRFATYRARQSLRRSTKTKPETATWSAWEAMGRGSRDSQNIKYADAQSSSTSLYQ